jgi:uncharacterized SAM-binding protein YcdF (DUF218 family)
MRNWKRFLPLLVIPLLVLFLVATSGSRLIGMKVIAFLILPSGFLWIFGLALVCWPGFKRSVRIGCFAGWILYSMAGSPYVGNLLLRTLEAPFYQFEQPEEPLDVIVLLGGGTARTPGGRPALGTHGDRVLRPALHYRSGLAKILVTTGRSITERGADRLLSRETSEIWQAFGIPPGDILELPDPTNTAEELAAVAELAESHPGWKRIGLSSSASHLPRAMKEAANQGLEVIPVPSDFRSAPMSFSPMYLIPQGRGFRDVQTALWEYLGMLL